MFRYIEFKNCFPSSLADTTCFILGDVIIAKFTRIYLKCICKAY